MVVHGVFVSGICTPQWPGPGGAPVRSPGNTHATWASWRLVAPNHRELGRAAHVFADVDACIEAVAAIRTFLDVSVMTLAKRTSEWTWRLTLGDEVVAVASRLYQRQRECEYNSRVFLLTAATAQPLSNYVVPHPRLDLELGATTE
jgi:hypothetical protein